MDLKISGWRVTVGVAVSGGGRWPTVKMAGLMMSALFTVPATAQEPLKIMLFGDSLVAGYGLAEEEAIPMRLEEELQELGLDVTVLNAGVSGDTTAGGVRRLAWALSDGPDFVVVELGANDGLRGIDPANTRENLEGIMAELSAADIPSMLAGMLAPRNLGPDYAADFDPIFSDLSAEFEVPLYPFFLEGVALVAELNQPDGIHPNPAGVDVIVERFAPAVVEALQAAGLVE